MADQEEIIAAEKRGYSKGYQAGKKRLVSDGTAARERAAERAFLDRAFLQALPACIAVEGWKAGEKLISTKEERTRLAWSFAEEALKQRRLR